MARAPDVWERAFEQFEKAFSEGVRHVFGKRFVDRLGKGWDYVLGFVLKSFEICIFGVMERLSRFWRKELMTKS